MVVSCVVCVCVSCGTVCRIVYVYVNVCCANVCQAWRNVAASWRLFSLAAMALMAALAAPAAMALALFAMASGASMSMCGVDNVVGGDNVVMW